MRRRKMMMMKMVTCQSTTWLPVTKTTISQLRKKAAAPVHPAPVPAPPRAPPAPVHGLGPGKRVQVKGNSGQNVSIGSIFFWFTNQHQLNVLLCSFVVLPLLNPYLVFIHMGSVCVGYCCFSCFHYFNSSHPVGVLNTRRCFEAVLSIS